ncbi:lipopolysaccharide biosynthesis protein [Chitinophaga oryzae]|uniref:Lipopolysaccharide biosynthesis protein n=1 Tax=Chitinophaga oryzae TaxID=2725414 RepID=A0AAE6ZJE8_9BACT|nr:lipopolysaccharide biosynthesis protein [Chitinophaga oryzae]QJB34106.1 lipopolysaccharide biosynthesis protein [Chitinophaga oryzae]QJB40625.1 lipopolysaccharide biosynthesis protein [Chitinophaga oryzae]
MLQSYTKNYIRIYFWQILSIVLNLLSLFIVIPQLSSQPGVYGIYSICVSAIIFLSYADLGFLSAGYKYASEAYAKRDREREVDILGFICFILFCLVLIFSGVMLLLSFHPEWLIKGINKDSNLIVAQRLLLILAIFSPNVVLQRALQVIFGVRLEDYIYQIVLIAVSICKILSVFYFFRPGHYDIVPYFLFTQIVTTTGLLYAFYLTTKRYGISLMSFLKRLRFSPVLFKEIKALALSTFFITLSWIIYYELDIYAIARLSGAQAVAYYSIGLTCLSFFRSIFGTLFNPFSARFNHFVALNDEKGLRSLYKTVLCVMLPPVVFPIIAIASLSKPFVFSWVGSNFSDSVQIVRLLVLSNILAFISYPSGMLMVANKNIKALYFLAILQPVLFWGGISLLFPFIGYLAFSYFTLLSFMVSGAIYLWISLKFLRMNLLNFLGTVIRPAVLPVLAMLLILIPLSAYLPQEKSKLNLLLTVFAGGTAALIALVIYYFTSTIFCDYIKNIYYKFVRKG